MDFAAALRPPLVVALVVDEHGAVQGLVTLHDIVEAIAGDLSSVDEPLGRVPSVGNRFEREGLCLAVVDMDGHRGAKILVTSARDDSRLATSVECPPRVSSVDPLKSAAGSRLRRCAGSTADAPRYPGPCDDAPRPCLGVRRGRQPFVLLRRVAC